MTPEQTPEISIRKRAVAIPVNSICYCKASGVSQLCKPHRRIVEALREAEQDAARRAFEEAMRICDEEITGQPLDKISRYDEGYDTACMEIKEELRLLMQKLCESKSQPAINS